jgi:hypothetical protein
MKVYKHYCTTLSESILFADDISVIISSKNFDDFFANTVLSHISKWFISNKLVINLDKTSIIKFITNKSLQLGLNVGYDEKYGRVNKYKIPMINTGTERIILI